MFLIVLFTITAFWLGAEWSCYRLWARSRGRTLRYAYITFSALMTVPFWVHFIIGQVWDISTPFMASAGAVTMSLFLIAAIAKITLAIGLWCGHWCKSKWPQTIAVIIAILTTITILYGSLIEIHQLRTQQITLYFDNLPAEADGVRIAQISDVHFSLRPSSLSMAKKLAGKLAEIKPDLIIDCGDLVNSRHSELTPEIMEQLARITAPLGVYTVEGNHDKGNYIADTLKLPIEEHRRLLSEKIAKVGWRDITGQSERLPNGLWLTGICYPESLGKGTHGESISDDYGPNFAHLPEDAFNIVLSHNPIAWPNILAATRAELTLSGHVHSMQIKLPVGERGWSPAMWLYTHWSGLYEQEGCYLHITDGIGNGVPVRLGVPPQITVLELRVE